MKENTVKKYVLWTMVLLIYFGLPTLILFNVLNFNYKFIYLTIGGLLVYIIMRILKYDNSLMGLTLHKTKYSILSVLPITIILLIIGIILFFTGYGNRFNPTETLSFYIFYLFISSPIQEFLYRGALPRILNSINLNESLICIITSLLYSYVHIIYRDFLTLILTFLIGLIWYRCYKKSSNLIGVSISHAVLGILTIMIGIID